MKKLLFICPLLLSALALSGCQTLGDAASSGDVPAVKKFITEGADVNELNYALMSAAWRGHRDVAELLVAKGANVNMSFRFGETPLHAAAYNGYKDFVEFLLAKGADASMRTDSSQTGDWAWENSVTPRVYAEHQGHMDVAAILKKAEAEGPRRVEAAEDPREKAAFEKVARDYRNAPTKPALPEEAHKYKVQAEGAVRDKQFDDAAELYGKALEIAPWWPEGHYNRALVLGGNRYYLGAIREMKRYLALAPNAPDARAAQDAIYDWERKAGK